jgi:hypothetical protein
MFDSAPRQTGPAEWLGASEYPELPADSIFRSELDGGPSQPLVLSELSGPRNDEELPAEEIPQILITATARSGGK